MSDKFRRESLNTFEEDCLQNDVERLEKYEQVVRRLIVDLRANVNSIGIHQTPANTVLAYLHGLMIHEGLDKECLTI